MALQGMSGHVAVNAYLQQIISDGGLAASAGPFAIGVDALRVVATVVAGLTVERFGRKKLFVGGGLVQVCWRIPAHDFSVLKSGLWVKTKVKE